MATYTIDLPGIPSGSTGEFPHTADALEQIAHRAHSLWLSYAQGAPLPNGQQIQARSGGYAASIKVQPVGPLAWEVYSDAPYASAIEEGSKAFDMKAALGSAAKARVAKSGAHKGQRYLIIPFRHGSPGSNYGAMPASVHAQAINLSPSHVTGSFSEPSVNHPGTNVNRLSYSWGDRLASGLAPKLKSHHKTDPYSGMVKMANPGGGHSQYLTFRVMGEWSSGWIRPAQAGKYPARTVKEVIEPVAQRILQAALDMDLAHQVGRIEAAFR